ncbi:MAG: NAD(+) kinase [Gammaproteobacteria bacterium]|nr:NAD(+) kinase [Gammaproteobacteria bacterium]
MFKRVGLISRKGDPKVRAIVATLAEHLRRRGLEVVLDDYSAELLGAPGATSPQDSNDASALFIAIGGDGTMLAAARWLFDRPDVRLLGVNLGRLGFLTDLSPEQLPEGLDRILDGDYTEDERFFLECRVNRGADVVAHANALNDVTLLKWNTARLITFDTYIDDRFVHSQRSDGIIVCTPTGSTAYALSGGGPILDPALAAVGLVPICPHALTNRPLVVANDCLVEFVIRTTTPDLARVTCDGEGVIALEPEDRVSVRKAGRAIRLIHPAGHDHFATLRAKLHWGRDPC